MKYLYLIIFLLFISTRLTAQSNYKPGYCVNMNGDTLKGFIDYRGWDNNPKTFNFKQTLNDKDPQKFSVDNSKAFAINGIEYYQRFITRVSTGNIDINNLPVHIDTNRKLDTVFLNIITSGRNVMLYNYTDKIKTRFFIKDTRDNELKELGYYIYLLSDNTTYTETKYTYRQQLSAVASYYKPGDKKLADKIAFLRYAQPDIQKVVELINGGADQQLKQDDLFGVRYFAGVGARFSTLTLYGGEAFFPDGTSAKNTAAAINAGVDFFFNKHTQKFAFRVEIGFTSAHYSVPSTLVNGNETYASLDFKQTNYSVYPQIVYNFYNQKRLKLFVDGGMLLNISSYNNYYLEHTYADISSTKQYGYPAFKHFAPLVPFKAGARIDKHIELYAAYAFALPITSDAAFSANISYFQTGINYLF